MAIAADRAAANAGIDFIQPYERSASSNQGLAQSIFLGDTIGGNMEFHVGDPVMHWMYGFGHIIGIEERAIADQKTLYYAISIRDLTVWVPADEQLESRLRHPTTKEGFRELFAILTGVGEPLPVDRQERRVFLVQKLKDGQAASLCHALRDLSIFQQAHTINYNDENLMKRLREALLGEWAYALAIPISIADAELHRMLGVGAGAGTNQVIIEERFKVRRSLPGKRSLGTQSK